MAAGASPLGSSPTFPTCCGGAPGLLPVALRFDVVVLDESHRCKNPTSARSKLAAKLVGEAGFTLWRSATAGQNPLELSNLTPLLASTTGARSADLKDFEQWCVDQKLGSA